jgi:outer membrane autotransporter protein
MVVRFYLEGVVNTNINVTRDNSILGFGATADDGFVTYVNANITINSNITSTVLIGDDNNEDSIAAVYFSGSINAASGSNTTIEISSNSNIGHQGGGNITLDDGDDTILSNFGAQISSQIDMKAGDDNFNLIDSSVFLTGSITNLENIDIGSESSLIIYDGGSYSGNVSGSNFGFLRIGANQSNQSLDESEFTYNAAGTVDNVSVVVGGSATFNTNGHEFGADTYLHELAVINDSTFNMQDNVLAADITLSDNGTIRIGANATLTSYSLTNYANGTLIFDIASPTQAGFLNVAEEELDLTSLTIEANLTGADSLFRNGNQIKVAQGTTALYGTDGNLGQESTQITENSALFSIRMMDGSQLDEPALDSELYFVFSQESTIQQVATSGNNKDVGAVLDSLSGTSNPELSQIINKINAASQDEINSILESTTPDISGGVAVGSQNFVNNTLDITSEQINLARNSHSGVAAGDEITGLRMWGQFFYQDAQQGIRKGVAGFDSSTNGTAFGFDTADLIEDAILGVGFSFGSTEVKSNNASNSKNNIDSYQLSAYGSYNLLDNYFVKAMASYAINDVETARYNIAGLGMTARGDYTADIYSFRSDIGKDFKNGAMRITPSILAHYSLYDAENYTETGAGGANLSVNTKSMEIFELGSTIELGWDIKLDKERSVAPEVRVGYRYNFIGDKFITSSSFTAGGAAFNTVGARPAQGAITIGGGLKYQISNQWDFSVNYEYEKRQDFNSNSGFVRAYYSF